MSIFKKKPKKKLRETRIGKFLKEKGSGLLDVVGDVTGKLMFNKLADLVNDDDKLSDYDKAMAQLLIEVDKAENENVTERWKVDLTHGHILSKISRPIILFYSWVAFTLLIILAACGIVIPDHYLDMFQSMALAINAAFFGSIPIEKYHQVKHGKNSNSK